MVDRDLCGCTLGEFVLRELIDDEGGFGAAVYRGEQPLLRRDVVVKVLHYALDLLRDRSRQHVLQRRERVLS